MKKVNDDVKEYVSNKISNVYIVLDDQCGGLFSELYDNKKITGWSYQLTETAGVFFNDNDYIERGDLLLSESELVCHHAWLCFNYNNKEYVFDPALDMLVTKDYYYDFFNIVDVHKISINDVKKDLLNNLDQNDTALMNFENDINDPFYMSGVHYQVIMNNGEVTGLNAAFNYPKELKKLTM